MKRATYVGMNRRGETVRHIETCPEHAQPLKTIVHDGVRCELESLVGTTGNASSECTDWLKVSMDICAPVQS